MADTPATETTEQVQSAGAAAAAPAVEASPASTAKPDVATEGAGTPAPAAEGAKPNDAGSEQSTDSSGGKGAPETYDLKLPQGSKADPGLIEGIASFAKERGLSNDVAQAVLEREVAAVQEFAEQMKPNGKLWLERETAWRAESLASKEIGGNSEKLAKSIETAKKAIDRFFPKESHQFLHESGLGSHPAMLAALVKIGNAFANDKSVKATPGAGSEMSLADRMYGENSK